MNLLQQNFETGKSESSHEIKNWQGEEGGRVFRGESASNTVKELYVQSAENFAEIIKGKIPAREEPYLLADLGGHKGELLENLLAILPEYHFDTVTVDVNEDALAENTATQMKIIGSLDHLPLGNASVDLAMARYVLPWNDEMGQRKILKEISRVVKSFAIVEHAGADNEEPAVWREHIEDLFDGEEVSKLKRGTNLFSSRKEVEQWMQEDGIKFERVAEKRVEKVSNVFIEKWVLDPEESQKTRDILGDKDYIIQTRWVIYPNG